MNSFNIFSMGRTRWQTEEFFKPPFVYFPSVTPCYGTQQSLLLVAKLLIPARPAGGFASIQKV
jgi:hypothetical protein